MTKIEWQAKHLLYEYDLFLRRLEQRGENRWRAETDRGIFLLERTNEHPAQVYFVASWLHYLYSQGIRSVVPFCVTKYGEPYIVDPQGMYVVKPWVEEVESIRSMPKWEEHVLREISCIHSVSEQTGEKWKGYAPVSFGQIKQRWKEGIAGIMAVAETAGWKRSGAEFEWTVRESAVQVRRFAERAIQELIETSAELEEEQLIRAFCHGRIHRRNIIVGPGRQIYLTSFEYANFDTPVRDLAIFFRRYAPYRQWSIQKGKEWLRAYEAERPLTETERRLLACYLLYPERLAQVARSHRSDAAEGREKHARQRAQTWRKHVRLLSKIHRFALSITQK